MSAGLLLSYDNILYHLLERGFITLEQAVAGGIEIRDCSSRNRNFIVCQPGGPNYFIKQTDMHKPQSRGLLLREASLYRQLFSEAPSHVLAVFPDFIEYDTGLELLVLEAVEPSTTFNLLHQQKERFPPKVAYQFGEMLGQVHVPLETLGDTSFLPRTVPWILAMHRTNFANHQDHSNVWVAEIVQQQQEFHGYLDALHGAWRHECLIHGDIKWENCLLSHDNQVFVVDWETADIGDAAWDVGAVFHAFLATWVKFISFEPGTEFDPRHAQEHRPIEAMHPAIHAFWQGYLHVRNLTHDAADDLLLRSVNYAAARLLQTAFEQSRHTPQVSENVLALIQVSLNILQAPQQAATVLLGLRSTLDYVENPALSTATDTHFDLNK